MDWIAFNFENLKDPKSIAKIAIYLLESFGFHSFLKDLKNASNKKSKPLILKTGNQFQCVFYISNLKYWTKIIVSFLGQNALHFYKLIRSNKID